jgi:hypothetical protein
MNAFLSGLFCGSLLAIAGQAAAQEAHSARADAFFRQAETLLQTGHVDAACAKFEASEAAENGLGTLLRLGDCYERAGRTASAWHTFLEAEAVANAAKDVEREQVAAQRVAALEPGLTRVVLVVPATSRIPSLSVRLGQNTIPITAWGTMIPVDAGVQHVSATAKGRRSWSMDVNVARGEAREYRINIPVLGLAPERVARNRRPTLRTTGMVTGGVGVAGIGAGALFSAFARSADDANTCAKGVIQCTPTRSTRAGNGDAAAVSLAVGGALLATGVTLFVLAPAADSKERDALRVSARVAGDGGRLQLEGAW